MDPLLETAPCGFMVIDDDGRIKLANATAAEMLDMSPEQLLRRHVDVLLSVASRIFYQTHVFPTLRLQGRVHEVYLSLVSGHGEEVPVLLNARRRDDGGDKVSDWVIVPMRQRNEYEDQILEAKRLAEEALRTKDQFLSLVSHELRSPLGAIRNWAAILLHGSADAATLKRGLEAIERNAALQATLVDDILDQVRIATGKLRLNLSEIDFASLLRNVLEAAQPTAVTKSIMLEEDLPAAPVLVQGDADRLQQILWNVLSNALKFTPAGGRVRAALRSEGPWAEIAISDNGRGITAEFLPYVFEHFRQEDRGATMRAGGLGLGMAITRRLVELHGGTISAASEGEGKGATFTVKLPIAQHASASL